MFIVIADDFSGAAEIAGIAHRHGARVELTTTPSLDHKADILVIDTDSRRQSAAIAERIHQELAQRLANLPERPAIFKKVDSVLRGHVAIETHALASGLDVSSIYLLPANPSRQRIISQGRYMVAGKLITESMFARDPHFPAVHDNVRQILQTAAPNTPVAEWEIPDTENHEAIRTAIGRAPDDALIVGGADAFEEFLQKYRGRPPSVNPALKPSAGGKALIVHGSAMTPAADQSALTERGVPQLTPTEFSLNEVNRCFRQCPMVAVETGPHLPILIPTLLDITTNAPEVHLALTGGATATAVLRHLGTTRFTVSMELAPGVVTLLPRGENCGPITVKPGSYVWPATFFDLIFK